METRESAFALRSSAASGWPVFIIARNALFVKGELRRVPNCAKLRRPEGRRSESASRPSGQRRRPRGQRRPDRGRAQARGTPTPSAEPREAHRGAEEADAPTTEQPGAEARTQPREQRTRAEPNDQAAATDAPSGRDPTRHRPTGNDHRAGARRQQRRDKGAPQHGSDNGRGNEPAPPRDRRQRQQGKHPQRRLPAQRAEPRRRGTTDNARERQRPEADRREGRRRNRTKVSHPEAAAGLAPRATIKRHGGGGQAPK